MAKKIFKHHKRKRHGTAFWDHEYTHAEHLALSDEPSGDLLKFTRWLERRQGKQTLNPTCSVVDLGCGNGRNLVYLAKEYGMRGTGYDSSAAAIKEARRLSAELPLTYETRSIAEPVALPDESQHLALDMMSSHFLDSTARTQLRDEIARLLRPGGFLFMKTFVRDGDIHTRRLIEEFPGPEENSYIHPVMGVAEHVYSEEELVSFLKERFIVHKTYLSHKHVSKGRARKRRTISVYCELDPLE